MEPEVITVGLDGSAESLAAARWAAEEAERRRAVLRLLHAWILLAAEGPDTPPDRDQNAGARRLVEDALAEVRTDHPDLRIIEDLVGSEAVPALLRAAEGSQLLALGSRALTAWESYVLGDVSLEVVGRADRPVVLVREGWSGRPAFRGAGAEDVPSPAPHVVVGMGLTAPCDALLAFAFDAAARRGLPLHAVHGRALPVTAYAPWGIDPEAAGQFVGEREETLRETLRPWRERFPGVEVAMTVRPENPTRALVHSAPGAVLLAVGRRRRHAFVPRVGPVAHAAMHHAACPVAVVPDEGAA
ncbi:universal stress protein [Streptomyces catenulae]|uniref:Universal stress protein n=1 Tax=Streptomyces catenulae TaxID=66875 RepID=A0ABV2YWK9_9ACTN|nr:universal stress protein [Streptomyces catenulae]